MRVVILDCILVNLVAEPLLVLDHFSDVFKLEHYVLRLSGLTFLFLFRYLAAPGITDLYLKVLTVYVI